MLTAHRLWPIFFNKGLGPSPHLLLYLFVHSPLFFLPRQGSYREMQPLWICDFKKKKNPVYEMVHYGWAYAASWQMLRHASMWEPAGRGRGRRDAVATRHRFTQVLITQLSAGPHTHTQKTNPFAAIRHLQSFLESCPSTDTHVWKGERLVFCAQNDCDQPSANIALSNAPNVRRLVSP